MNKIIVTLSLLIATSTSAFAAERSFQCASTENKSTMAGTMNEHLMIVTITDDPKIEMYPFNTNTLQMERYIRKNEAKYSFAAFYNGDNNYDINISIPKNMNSRYFVSYVTLYIDDGDRMVPDTARKYQCRFN